MEAVAIALLAGLALALFGEALKFGLERWFKRRHPARLERCPNCGGENLDRGLSSGQSLTLGLLSLVLALALVLMVFSAFVVLLGLVSVIFRGRSLDGYVAGAAGVLLLSTVVFRLLARPVGALRARPPVRCRHCRYDFPVNEG